MHRQVDGLHFARNPFSYSIQKYKKTLIKNKLLLVSSPMVSCASCIIQLNIKMYYRSVELYFFKEHKRRNVSD